MKKLFYSAAIVALAFFAGSCQQENLEPVGGNTVTYTVQVPDALATRALGDDITNINVLHYEVYRTEVANAETFTEGVDNLLYHKTAVMSNGVATINLELVNDQNYTVLFWAQVGETNEAYEVSDLTNVTVKSALNSNQVNYAAFAGRDFIVEGKNLVGRTVTLERPISQINIATTPESLKGNGAFMDAVVLEGSSVTVYGLSNSFNVATQEPGAAMEAEYEFAEQAVPTDSLEVNGKNYAYVAMNYVGFADAVGTNVKVSYVINTTEGNIDNDVENVPVKPNYRTNIIGNLITATSDYTVTLDAEWDGVENEIEIWDGKFLSQPSQNEAGEWQVTKASELAWLAAAVNGEVAVTKATEETFAGNTFVLTADIDLANFPWTPIGLTGDKPGFQGTFDGQGHTISNLYVDLTAEPKHQSAGLFGSARYATIKNLTIKNATIKNLDTDTDATSSGTAVVVGASQYAATIYDVHVVNAVVTSNRRTAGIAGYFVGTIENCSVDGLTATATPDDYDGDGKYSNGDKAGGILATTNGATILKNNVVRNANIKGYRNLGGLAGAANLGENSSNTVENTVVTVDRTYAMVEEDAALSGPIVGRIMGGTLADSNVATDVVVVSTEEGVETPETFADALEKVADGGVVAVSGEIETTTLKATGKKITIVGTTEDATINVVSDGNYTDCYGDITFKNLTIKVAADRNHYEVGLHNNGGTHTYENCKFYGLTTAWGDCTYNNCEFVNNTKGKYAAWVYAGNVVYNNCTITAVNRAAKVFNENADGGINAIYNNCRFIASGENTDKAAVEFTVENNTNKPNFITINNAEVVNMKNAEHWGNEYFNLETSGKGLGIVTLDGKGYSVAHTAAQLQALTNAGKDVTIELAQDITGDVTILQQVGADVVIDGCAVNYDGSIIIDGDNRNTGVETLTISNINFATSDKKTFISAPGELNGKKERYSHNITIDGCTFSTPTFNEEISAISTQKTYNFTVKNCSAKNLHSLLQVQSCDNKVYVENVTVTGCKNGISFGNTAFPTLIKADIECLGYGVRGDGDASRGKLVMKNVDITAAYPLTIRKMKTNSYSVELAGENTLTAMTNEYQVIFTNNSEESVIETPIGTYSIIGADNFKVYPRDNQ